MIVRHPWGDFQSAATGIGVHRQGGVPGSDDVARERSWSERWPPDLDCPGGRSRQRVAASWRFDLVLFSEGKRRS